MKAPFRSFILPVLVAAGLVLSVDLNATLLSDKRSTNESGFTTLELYTANLTREARTDARAERRKSRRIGPTPEPEPEPKPTPTPSPEPQVKAPPAGIYHSAGAITRHHRGGTLVREGINDQAHVAGTLVRVEWAALNTAPGVFDFSAIDNELAKAAELNTSVNLAVLDSLALPAYILNECETFAYQFRRQDQVTCLPWDETYQHYKSELIAAVGERYDVHPNLTGVYFSYSAMTNGIEMHWRVSEAAFTAAGYTEARLLDSYNRIMDMYNEAFPSTSVIMEVHEVFRSPTLAENAFDYCYATMGSRCGVAIWWCSSRMASNPRESEYDVFHVAQQATTLSFAVCQSIGSFTDSPERFDSGQDWTSEEAFSHEMTFFINEGFRHFEIWSNDIVNPSLVDLMQEQVLPALN